MRKRALTALFGLLPLLLVAPVACSHTFSVKRVIDGDTVVLNNGRTIRLIGVDTPESRESQKLEKDIERTERDKETIQLLGKKAATFTRSLILRKKVRLEYDLRKKDRYGRTLAYLFLEDGTFVNLEIIRQGFGNAYVKFPFKYLDEFREAERTARENRRGLWKEGEL